MNRKQLIGHTSPETAYVVTDYPYGFRLRCQIRYWIETKPGHGQRLVSQTSNPKVAGLVWNNPKASTYTQAEVLFIDGDTGHVKSAALTAYADMAEVEAFAASWQLDEYQDRIMRLFRVARRIRNGMSKEDAIAKAGVPA